jgi:hypothetical protein
MSDRDSKLTSRRTRHHAACVPALTALCLLVGGATPARAQDAPPTAPAQPPATKPAQPSQGGGGQLGMFVNAMKNAPGCLGVDQGQVRGGRLALFGWFDGKKNALAFANGPVAGMLKRATQLTPVEGDALADVTDEKTPVLVFISFTPTQEKDAPAGLGQAAVEFWKPVVGGFAYAARFAPDAVTVSGLLYAKKDPAKAAAKEPGGEVPAKPAEPAPNAAPAQPPTQPPASGGAAKPSGGAGGQGMNLGGLLPALESSPGCLGVAALQMGSGKLAIVAYFKDKKACLDWYYGVAHQRMMLAMPPPTRKPLEDVKDENAPVIVIASLTPTDQPNPELGMPLSQIAVELYTPAKGGFARGGNFLPPPAAPKTAPTTAPATGAGQPAPPAPKPK